MQGKTRKLMIIIIITTYKTERTKRRKGKIYIKNNFMESEIERQ